MPLFAQVTLEYEKSSKSSIPERARTALDLLKTMEIDALTPREAMNFLYELAELAEDWEKDI